MASATRLRACRSCGSASVERHCESPTCTWARCRRCHSYGDDAGGGRWHDARKPKDAL